MGCTVKIELTTVAMICEVNLLTTVPWQDDFLGTLEKENKSKKKKKK